MKYNLKNFVLYQNKTCFNPRIFPDGVHNLVVEASPLAPGGAIAYYEPGSQDGSRPGTFYTKLDPLSAQKRYEATTLVLHEGNPGHNFQFSFNKNQGATPQFITNPMFDRLALPLSKNGFQCHQCFRYSEAPSRFNMPTAHVEGWGLYSEYLGFEMGLYEDSYAR